jgi:hypothetical protein
MRAARNEAQQVLGTDDRQQERLEVAVEGRDEECATGTQQPRERPDHRRRIGDVLEHFHARDHIESRRRLAQQLIRADHAIVDGKPALGGVQPCHLDHARRQIDAADRRAGPRKRFTEQSAATANIERPSSAEGRARCDELEAHGIQQVQRTELSMAVPEACRQCIELRELGAVGVAARGGRRWNRAHAAASSARRRVHSAASAASSASLKASNRPVLSAARPAVHTSVTCARVAPNTIAAATSVSG